MQGIFITSAGGQRRPTSKKELKQAAADDPSMILIEATSLFGNEYGGLAHEMPEGQVAYFTGPDPHTDRRFYGQIYRKGDKVTVK